MKSEVVAPDARGYPKSVVPVATFSILLLEAVKRLLGASLESLPISMTDGDVTKSGYYCTEANAD